MYAAPTLSMGDLKREYLILILISHVELHRTGENLQTGQPWFILSNSAAQSAHAHTWPQSSRITLSKGNCKIQCFLIVIVTSRSAPRQTTHCKASGMLSPSGLGPLDQTKLGCLIKHLVGWTPTWQRVPPLSHPPASGSSALPLLLSWMLKSTELFTQL